MSSPNMFLPIPTVAVTSGPTWASNLNSCLTLIDAHDHSTGKGVQITPDGLDINDDLDLQQNNLINARSLRLYSNSVSLSDPTDLRCLYVVDADLYFNDGDGNEIRVTISGGLAGTPGSISGLVSPASASYSPVTATFTWQSDIDVAASLDCRDIILRNSGASSYGCTLSPPAAMSSDIAIVLPSIPAATKIVNMDNSGNLAATYVVDDATIEIDSNTIQVKDEGIDTTQLADSSVTLAKLAAEVLATLLPPGTILPYGGTSAPTGFLLCDGTSYLRASYAALYAIIGNAFGTADGTHFNVPDFRGRFLRGRDGSAGRDPNAGTRTAMNTGGNTGDNVGSIQSGAVDSHTHFVVESNSSSTGSLTASNRLAISRPTGGDNQYDLAGDSSAADVGLSSANSSAGSETRPINAYVNYIIKT